ncbi:MAG: L-threonylcarbamoyladenylate synthase [Halobacteriota archaeon]
MGLDDDRSESLPSSAIAAAADAIEAGGTIVYPTETVYGLGADGRIADAVERVFELKRRDRTAPISIAVSDLETAARWGRLTDLDRAFLERFLPGPVTVVVERSPSLPAVLTAGRDRVGLRIPDHPIARSILRAVAPTPITATSANLSGHPSVRRPADLPASIREGVDVVVDGGETPGGGSTVVDPQAGVIHRRGPQAEAIERWLDAHRK